MSYNEPEVITCVGGIKMPRKFKWVLLNPDPFSYLMTGSGNLRIGDFTQTLTIAQASRAATDDHIALSGSSLKNYLLGVTIDN